MRSYLNDAPGQKNADMVEKSPLANPGLRMILVSHHLSPEWREQFTKVYDLRRGQPPRT